MFEKFKINSFREYIFIKIIVEKKNNSLLSFSDVDCYVKRRSILCPYISYMVHVLQVEMITLFIDDDLCSDLPFLSTLQYFFF